MRALVGHAFAAALATVSALGACGDDGALPVADGCNPLGYQHCMAPWPSSVFEVPDATTRTGQRLAIPTGTLLTHVEGQIIDPAPWNLADGFSAAAAIVTAFPGGVDPANLVDQAHFADSLGDTSPTVLLDLTTGERVAHFAEVDVPAAATPDRQALFLRPAARLIANRRYAVAIRSSLRGKTGGALPISPGFRAVLDGAATSHPLLERARPRLEATVAALEAAGVPRTELVQAWDFTVASDEHVRRLPTAARDRAIVELDRTPQTARLVRDEPIEDGVLTRRRVDGFVTAPLFLTQDGVYAAGTELATGPDGLPVFQRMYEIPFTAIIPACAYTAATPVAMMIYGHGLNGSGAQAAANFLRTTAQELCVIVAGTDMRGMSERDLVNIARALTDLNNAGAVFEVLVQGIVNHVALARALETVLAETVFVCRPEDATATGCRSGARLADPSRVYYYGLSQGHIFGTAHMAYLPTVRRGVLGVGGGNYSTMLERSTDWPGYRMIMIGAYPDPLDVVMAVNLFQQRWDQTETSGVANVVLAGTPTGVPPKQVLLHMAVGDEQVPNLSTEWQARTMGIPALLPGSSYLPYGMTGVAGPIANGSALVIMDGGAPPFPLTNEPALDTGMHDLTRNQAASRRQMRQFFETGVVVNECDGPCMCAAGKCD